MSERSKFNPLNYQQKKICYNFGMLKTSVKFSCTVLVSLFTLYVNWVDLYLSRVIGLS